MKYSVQKNIEQSDAERRVSKYLISKGLKFAQEVIFEECRNPITGCHLRFDFYLPNHNLLIEYDGKQWHKGEDVKSRDEIKNQFAHNQGLILLRVQGYKNLGRKIDLALEGIVDKLAIQRENEVRQKGIADAKKRGTPMQDASDFGRLISELMDLKKSARHLFTKRLAAIRREDREVYLKLRPIVAANREASSRKKKAKNAARKKKC